MKKQRTKLAVLLLALGCASVGIGAGTLASVNASNPTVTASAETAYTTHEIGKLDLHVNSKPIGGAGKQNNALYLQAADGKTFPILSWDYFFIAENADCFKINGVAATLNEMKSTDAGMFFSFAALNAGDIITISGKFICEAQATKYTIAESKFRWTGSSWETYIEVEYTEYNIGKLKFAMMQPNALNMAYFNRADSEAIPIMSTENDINWTEAFTFLVGSGVGITLNGQAISPGVKFPGDIFVEMSAAPNAGDVMVIGGTFYNQVLGVKYIIEESTFKFNGTAWENYTVVNYTEYKATAIAATKDSSASLLFIYPAGGIDAFPNGNDGEWKNVYGFVAGSGEGMKLNGVALTTEDIKLPGTDLFIGLGVTAKEGDIFTIDGSYANATTGIKLTFENCALKYNGTAWETYEATPEINYTEYTATAIAATRDSNASALHIYPTGGIDAFPNGNGDWESKYAFEAGSGEGMKLNGVALTTEDIKLPGTDLFIGLGVTANAGDIFTIDGSYANAAKGIKLTFENCMLKYNGTAWETYEGNPETPDTPDTPDNPENTYTEYTVNELTVHLHSTAGNEFANNTTLWLNGTGDLSDAWAYYVYESGEGIKINGQLALLVAVQDFSNGLYLKFEELNAGDVISISGTFVCEQRATKYIIAESEFVWTGSGWEKYVEYTSYEIGSLIFASMQPGFLNMANFGRADGEMIPIVSVENDVNWTTAFKFLAGSGVGVTMNGQSISPVLKFPHDLFVELSASPNEGDVMVIGGTFYSETLAVKYVVAESSFVFNGSVWVEEIKLVKAEAAAALDEYKANFAQENYYEAEWASFDTIIENGKANISAATTKADVEAAWVAAKEAMDNVVTKEESDAIFDGLKVTAKVDLAAYKAESDYRAEQWAEIQAILTQANAEIDASASVTAINTAVESAKAAMDAVKTAAQVEAEEAAVAAAKAELAAYKTESTYKAAQWAEIQAIITEANTAIDNAIGNQATIDEIVTNAKVAMDAVKTAEQVDADAAVVAAAKAELTAYKTEDNYKATQWAEIQAIITKANGDIDNASGDEAAINAIVTAAKAEMDKVMTAKEASKDEVRAYYNALDHDLYSEADEETISGYMATVMAAIDSAATIEEMDAAIAQFKANVESVATQKPAEDKEEEKSAGCGGSLVAGGVSASVALAATVAVLFKKKED